MKTVKKTSIFPASKNEIFKRLLELKTLQYIAYPYATFTPVDGTNDMSWVVGSTSSLELIRFMLSDLDWRTESLLMKEMNMFQLGITKSFLKNCPKINVDIQIKLI